MRKVMLAVIAGASILAAPAAAAPETGDAPAQAPSPTRIVYADEGVSRMNDMPLGVHRIPDSNVVVSGHQKGGGIGLLFGVVGMAIQSSANASGGTARVQNVEDNLRFDATAKATELTGAILADGTFGQRFTQQAADNILNVSPYIVITFQGENEVRPYIVLKTKLYTAADQSPKAEKYFCCEGKALPLSGPGGLAENGGAELKALLTAELDTAIRVMLQDRAQPYTRDKATRITVKGNLPFVGKPFKMKGYDLGKYNDYSLIDFSSGLLVFGGVNIAEPGSLEVLPPK
ncbi:hypothetical protein [Sphingomonas sp.]|uniref:hypothetical protein n=1 Tax=Sphingomonas sp. TaxID=28214 RepID=UPI0025EB931E|nr:hypothetical protein [Sphingomonas sp.]